MDALKRAEANKQGNARQGEVAPPAPVNTGLSLEPLNGAGSDSPAPQSLPDLAAHIDAVDADLAASVAPTRKPAPGSAPTSPPAAGREAARVLFAAKEPVPASRTPLYLTLGILGGALLAIAIYFWLQLQSLGGGSLNRPHATPTAPPLARPAPLATAPSTLPTAPSTLPLPPQATAETVSSERPARRTPEPTAETREPASPIRLTRSRVEIDPNLSRGWHNLQANALEPARQDYERALKNDPKNIDALLGLAAIAQRQGRQTDAERLQQLANAADPKDAGAQAALINQSAAADPLAAESRLKTLLADQPHSAPLHFALGNLYARQGRWGEAQQSYFNTVACDGENPDYLFNLAVSLDRMRQNKVAVEYYRQALEAATKYPPAFAPEQVRQRLLQLTPSLPP